MSEIVSPGEPPVESRDSAPKDSSAIASEAVTLVDHLTGDHEWSGTSPYEAKAIDREKGEAYRLEIRKGDDWITIQQQMADNPILMKAFTLEKRGDAWEYIDPTLAKYGESSLPEFEEVVGRLRTIWDTTKPTELEK